MTEQVAGNRELEHGRLGVASIVFMVLAAVAPMSATVAIVPLVIGLGNGTGAPGVWLVAGIVLALFAVGFAAMSHHVRNAGGFYAYVARGLSKPLGVAAAFIAVIAYNAMMISVTAIFSLFAQNIIGTQLNLHLPWQAWLVFALLTVGFLAWRDVEVSAKVLGVALVLEVAVLLIMDVAILIEKGFSAFTLDVFNPTVVFGGASGIALLLAFSTFIGFEQTAIYAEEAKKPSRTIPRAIYISVALVTGFYIITSWALIAGYGKDEAAGAAAADPAGFVFTANANFVGGITDAAMQVLVIISMFAGILSLHNATARYFFALGRSRLLPSFLARTHPRHRSPYLATLVQLAITALAMAPFAITNSDPYLGLGASMAGLGTLSVIVLQALAAFAIIGFFRRRGDRRWFTTLIAPLAGGAGMIAAIALAVSNYSALTGTTDGIANQLPWLLPAIGLAGLGYGFWLRSKRADVYAALGADAVSENAIDESDDHTEVIVSRRV